MSALEGETQVAKLVPNLMQGHSFCRLEFGRDRCSDKKLKCLGRSLRVVELPIIPWLRRFHSCLARSVNRN